MIKQTRIKIMALSLCAVMVLCSCGVKESAPALLEPVGAEPTFRPVEKTNLGVAKIIIGNVMGTEYCHFYEKNLAVKSINVSVGDYVKKGDVLVEADTESINEQLSDLYASLNILKARYETDKKKYDIELAKLELQKEQAEYEKNMGYGSEDYVKSIDKNIETYIENNAYSDEIYEFNKRKLNESIAELEKIVNEGVIKAKCDGYVTYVMDLRNGMNVSSYDNLVTVTDDTDLFISANIETRSYNYSKYGVKFAFIDGRKVPITEYAYSESETAYTKAQNVYPVQRFKTEEDVNLKIGDFVLMEFYNNDKNDVLAVGKDSYQTDDEGFFVYVRADDGTLEKRYFESGTSDEHYIEVVSGLEEGEMVLYTQEATLPKMEELYEVKLKTFTSNDTIKGVKYVEDSAHSYFSPDKAEVDKIYVKELDEVKKGDPLVRIVIDSEKGKIVEIENRIKDENRSYENDIKNYDKNREDLNKKINDATAWSNQYKIWLDGVKKSLADSNTSEADKISLSMDKAKFENEINELAYTIKFAEMDLKLLEYNKDIRQKEHDNSISSFNRMLASAKKDNDGTGYKTIYADYDGKVSAVSVMEGDRLDIGKKLVETVSYFDNIVKFGGGSDALAYGYTYPITIKDETFEGTIICGNNNPFAHVFTEDGKVYNTPAPRDLSTYYIKIDDEGFFKYESQFLTAEVTFPKMTLENVYNVPSDFIFTEKSFDNKEYNYVWVKNGDEVFKRYVQTGMDQRLGTLQSPVIINGLHEGDILVK